MRHPKDLSRRQFLTRAGGAAIAMPSLAAILAACSKPGSSAPSGAAGEIPIATLENPVTLPLNQDADRGRHADRVGPAGPVQLGRLHLEEGASRSSRTSSASPSTSPPSTTWRRASRRSSNGQVTARRVRADARLPAPARPEEPAPAAAARADPQHGGQRLAELLQPGPVLRPRVELHRPLHDLHVGRGLSPRPRQRRRGRGPGLGRAVEPRLQRRDQPVRLLRRHDRDHDPAQRQPRREHGRPRADRCRQGGDPADDQRQQGSPHDQRRLREDPGRRLHGRGVVVGRHRRRAVVPAEGHRHRRARLLAARRRQDDDRQRPAGDPDGGEEPAPRARVHQLHARREATATRTSSTGTATSRRSRRSTPTR